MRLVYSAAARSDLTEIGDFIARDSPIRARSFTRELLGACRAIKGAPFAAPALRMSGRELRRKVYKGYMIVYRVEPDRVEIARIFHGSRDYERLLASDP